VAKEVKEVERWDNVNYANLVIMMIRKALVDYTEHNELEFIRDVDGIYMLVPNDYKKIVDDEINNFSPSNDIWEHDVKMEIAFNKLNVIRSTIEPLIIREKITYHHGRRKDEEEELENYGQQL